MKKITLLLAITTLILCTSCSNQATANTTNQPEDIQSSVVAPAESHSSESKSSAEETSTSKTQPIESSIATPESSAVAVPSSAEETTIDLANELFISEFWNNRYVKDVYDEGKSNDKALEIYNPSDNVVDLSKYYIEIYSSGSSTIKNGDYKITLEGTLASKTTYTIVNQYAQDKIKAKADKLTSLYIGAKSAVGLYKDNRLIDVFGTIGKAYSSNAEVIINNIPNATEPHNIVRLEGSKASTTFNEAEWEVRFDTDLSTLGNFGTPVNTFNIEAAKAALNELIEAKYNYETSTTNGDIELITAYKGYHFSISIPYCPQYYSNDGKMISAPEDGFFIAMVISILDDNNNEVYTSYDAGVTYRA